MTWIKRTFDNLCSFASFAEPQQPTIQQQNSLTTSDTTENMPKKQAMVHVNKHCDGWNKLRSGHRDVLPKDGAPTGVRCSNNIPKAHLLQVAKAIDGTKINKDNVAAIDLFFRSVGAELPDEATKIFDKSRKNKKKIKKITFNEADTIASFTGLHESTKDALAYKAYWMLQHPGQSFEDACKVLTDDLPGYYATKKSDKEGKRKTRSSLSKTDGSTTDNESTTGSSATSLKNKKHKGNDSAPIPSNVDISTTHTGSQSGNGTPPPNSTVQETLTANTTAATRSTAIAASTSKATASTTNATIPIQKSDGTLPTDNTTIANQTTPPADGALPAFKTLEVTGPSQIPDGTLPAVKDQTPPASQTATTTGAIAENQQSAEMQHSVYKNDPRRGIPSESSYGPAQHPRNDYGRMPQNRTNEPWHNQEDYYRPQNNYQQRWDNNEPRRRETVPRNDRYAPPLYDNMLSPARNYGTSTTEPAYDGRFDIPDYGQPHSYNDYSHPINPDSRPPPRRYETPPHMRGTHGPPPQYHPQHPPPYYQNRGNTYQDQRSSYPPRNP